MKRCAKQGCRTGAQPSFEPHPQASGIPVQSPNAVNITCRHAEIRYLPCYLRFVGHTIKFALWKSPCLWHELTYCRYRRSTVQHYAQWRCMGCCFVSRLPTAGRLPAGNKNGLVRTAVLGTVERHDSRDGRLRVCPASGSRIGHVLLFFVLPLHAILLRSAPVRTQRPGRTSFCVGAFAQPRCLPQIGRAHVRSRPLLHPQAEILCASGRLRVSGLGNREPPEPLQRITGRGHGPSWFPVINQPRRDQARAPALPAALMPPPSSPMPKQRNPFCYNQRANLPCSLCRILNFSLG